MEGPLRGLTLVETIVASCLLGLVVLGIFTLLPSSLVAIRSAEHRIRADASCQEWLEILRQRPYENLSVGPLSPQPPDQEYAGVTFQTRAEIYKLPSAPVDEIKRLRVCVRWSFRGQGRQVSQETYRVNVARP